MAFNSDEFVASIFVAFVFPLSNPVCFVIEKALTQEIEALKEEVGNSQLEMEKQVKYLSARSVKTALSWMLCSLISVLAFSFTGERHWVRELFNGRATLFLDIKL